MNTLSWLIYIADVVGSLDEWLFGLSIATVFAAVCWLGIGICGGDNGFDKDDWKVWRKIGYLLILPGFLFGTVVGAIVPSRETVYAIAASEMGETALNTETGGKAVKALNAWLDRQIEDEPEQTEKTSD